MGFKTGAYAKVWEVKKISDVNTQLRISTSRKKKDTGEYEQDFSGFVSCLGADAARKAMSLKAGSDRIKLGNVEVTTRYNKEKKTTYTNFYVFTFELADGNIKSNVRDYSEPDAVEGDEDDTGELPF